MPLRIFCVIPALNEKNNIQDVVRGVVPCVDSVIVVDDGSQDDTAGLAEQAGATVLRHAVNRGQGAALRTGTEYAFGQGADIVVHFDADGQFLTKDIAVVTGPIVDGQAAIVFGSRFLDNTTKMPLIKRRVIMPLARIINKLFLGVELTDPQSGFRAFSRDAFKRLAWQQDGMAHASEILALSAHSGLAVKEVPITVIYHQYGQKFSGGMKILKDLFFGKLIR
ncbi:glycosyltransferase family 2 protein [Candidatus Falkowbacteria bacterium]|nr:glycosyltransferase family 2 protein [Candidatus Falkowbacteria bacterium]